MCSDTWNRDLRQNIWVTGQRLYLLKGKRVERFVPQLLTVPSTFPSVLRDISERGRDLEQILSQYITFVKPAFEEFCLPVSDTPVRAGTAAPCAQSSDQPPGSCSFSAGSGQGRGGSAGQGRV